MPANTDISENAALTAVRQKFIYGNVCELIACVRVATLPRNKFASMLRVM